MNGLHGQRIRDLQFLEPLGKGGMGEVWLAEHVHLRRRVAVKCPAGMLMDRPEFVERFFAEAQSQARLEHPNIVRVLDFFQEQGRLFLVMEFIEGESLAARIEREGAQPPPAAVQLAAGALCGLNHAHSKGLIHRDVKTSNIMVAKNGAAKIMDFGIAMEVSGKRLTSAGATFGTPHYMSPEQIRESRDVDHRTDVYSMGVVLYELLTGDVPFDAPSEHEVKSMHLQTPPTAPHLVNPSVPASLSALVLRALEKNPADRFAGCGAFQMALEEWARQPQAAPLGAAPARRVPTTPAPTPPSFGATPPPGPAAAARQATPVPPVPATPGHPTPQAREAAPRPAPSAPPPAPAQSSAHWPGIIPPGVPVVEAEERGRFLGMWAGVWAVFVLFLALGGFLGLLIGSGASPSTPWRDGASVGVWMALSIAAFVHAFLLRAVFERIFPGGAPRGFRRWAILSLPLPFLCAPFLPVALMDTTEEHAVWMMLVGMAPGFYFLAWNAFQGIPLRRHGVSWILWVLTALPAFLPGLIMGGMSSGTLTDAEFGLGGLLAWLAALLTVAVGEALVLLTARTPAGR